MLSRVAAEQKRSCVVTRDYINELPPLRMRQHAPVQRVKKLSMHGPVFATATHERLEDDFWHRHVGPRGGSLHQTGSAPSPAQASMSELGASSSRIFGGEGKALRLESLYFLMAVLSLPFQPLFSPDRVFVSLLRPQNPKP